MKQVSPKKEARIVNIVCPAHAGSCAHGRHSNPSLLTRIIVWLKLPIELVAVSTHASVSKV
jgi:hypothetical protein